MGVRKSIRKAKATRYAKGAKSRNKPRSERRIREVNHKLWDTKETLNKNYKNWGIITDPNKEIIEIKDEEAEAPTTEFLEELRERASNAVIKVNKPHMAVEDKHAIEKLIAKHGRDNIEDMSEDKRLNIYLWNPNQLRKVIAQYDKLHANN